MKKLLAMLLALIMVFSMVACSGSKEPAPSNEPEPVESVEPSVEPSSEPEPSVEPSAEPVEDMFDLTNVQDATAEDLVGSWHYVGLKKEGAWTAMDAKFVITNTVFTYGEYASSITIEGNVMNIIDWLCTMTCWYNAAGQLIIEDSRAMYYVCEDKVTEAGAEEPAASEAPSAEPSKAPESTPAPSATPAPSNAPEATPAPSKAPENTPAPGKLQDPYIGTYEVTAWCLYDYTGKTAVTNQQFIFTDNTVEYIVNGGSNGKWNYTARNIDAAAGETGDVVFVLTDANGSDSWYFVNQADGTLMIYDSALFIWYYCSKR